MPDVRLKANNVAPDDGRLDDRIWRGRRGCVMFVSLVIFGGTFVWHGWVGVAAWDAAQNQRILRRSPQHNTPASLPVYYVAAWMPALMVAAGTVAAVCMWWSLRHPLRSQWRLNFKWLTVGAALTEAVLGLVGGLVA